MATPHNICQCLKNTYNTPNGVIPHCFKGDQTCIDCNRRKTCLQGRQEIALRLYPQEAMESLRYINRCYDCELLFASAELRERILRRTQRVYANSPLLSRPPKITPVWLPGIPEEEEEEVTEIQLLPPVPLPPFPLPPRLSCSTPHNSPPIYRTKRLRSGKEY